jgi:hypothetical protein
MSCPVAGGACVNGSCTDQIDPNDTYWISIRVIDATAADTYSCSFTTPKPFVCISAQDDTGTVVNGCSGGCNRMDVCNLTQDAGLVRTAASDAPVTNTGIDPIEVPGSALINGSVTIKIFDDGYAFNNEMGEGLLPLSNRLSNGTIIMAGPYHKGTSCSGVTVQYEIVY